MEELFFFLLTCSLYRSILQNAHLLEIISCRLVKACSDYIPEQQGGFSIRSMGSTEEAFDGSLEETTAPAPLPLPKLPPSGSPSISLVPATLLERYQCWHINAHSWRGPLSVPQYIRREAFLERQLLTRNGKITYWILTDTSLPVGQDGARPILAS